MTGESLHSSAFKFGPCQTSLTFDLIHASITIDGCSFCIKRFIVVQRTVQSSTMNFTYLVYDIANSRCHDAIHAQLSVTQKTTLIIPQWPSRKLYLMKVIHLCVSRPCVRICRRYVALNWESSVEEEVFSCKPWSMVLRSISKEWFEDIGSWVSG